MTDLSIIIVNWNGCDLLRDCLKSLGSHPHCQIIVVDNASTDDSTEMIIREFPWVELVQSSLNLGFSGGNNLGLMQARGTWIMLLNNDTLSKPGFINQVLDEIASRPADCIIGPKLLNADGSTQPSFGFFPSLGRLFLYISMLDRLFGPLKSNSYIVTDLKSYDNTQKVDWISGACLIATRKIFDEVGGLDEGYFMYVEDVDWCKRANLLGYHCHFWPNAEIIHINSGSSKSRRNKVHFTYESLIRFYKKFHSSSGLASLRRILILATSIKLTLLSLAWLAQKRPLDAKDAFIAYGNALYTVIHPPKNQ